MLACSLAVLLQACRCDWAEMCVGRHELENQGLIQASAVKQMETGRTYFLLKEAFNISCCPLTVFVMAVLYVTQECVCGSCHQMPLTVHYKRCPSTI
jgi:hypothetical protein